MSRKPLLAVVAASLIPGLIVITPAAADEPTAAEQAFLREVQPFFEAHCVRCHNDQRQRGNFRIDTLSHDVGGGPSVHQWIVPSTRVWRGAGFATLDDIETGDVVQINLTRTTLFGPGRCLFIWLDEESRQRARERQRQRHLQHMRERGLPGWIDEVDNQQRILTITLFGGIDEELLKPFTKDTSVAVVVAEPSLRPHDPVNDRKSGPILEVEQDDARPGSSGVRIRCRPEVLLEGYRPRRSVRLYPGAWPVTNLPREERLWPDDVATPLAPTVEL